MLTGGCGTPPPKPVVASDGRPAYELAYRVDVNEIYKEIAQTCPHGFDVDVWDADHPKVVVCH